MTDTGKLLELVTAELSGRTTNKNLVKLLDRATGFGWSANYWHSLVAKMTREDGAEALFTWHLNDEYGWGPFPIAETQMRQAVADGYTFHAVSICVRLEKCGEQPFYATWQLGATPKGGPSWKYLRGRTFNSAPLTFKDALLYVEYPEVIQPEDPEGNTNDHTDSERS